MKSAGDSTFPEPRSINGNGSTLDDGRYRNRSVRDVVFHKGATTHRARIISYTETKTSRRGSKEQEVQLLTNSHDLGVDEVIAIYQMIIPA